MSPALINTAIGSISISYDHIGVTRLALPSSAIALQGVEPPPQWLDDAITALNGDIADYSHSTHIPVSLNLTTFQVKVLMATRAVPSGCVATYADIAEQIGHKNAVRAVGTALGKNPVPLIIPCHRVVKSDGRVGDFSAPNGHNLKCALLKHEGVFVRKDRVDLSLFQFVSH